MNIFFLAFFALFFLSIESKKKSNQKQKKRGGFPGMEDLDLEGMGDLGGFGDLGSIMGMMGGLGGKGSKKKDDALTKELENLCTKREGDEASRLKAFQEGSCSPIILVPGFTGSKLIAKVSDCKQVGVDILDLCKLNCTDGMEFDLWISTESGGLNFMSPYPGCLQAIGALDLDELLIKNKTKNRKGIEVFLYGETDKTRKFSDCFTETVSNFGGTMSMLSKDAQAMGPLINYLKAMGYSSGLNLFVVPYDFRKHTKANSFLRNFKRTVRLANELTGKKAFVIGHSFGGNNIINALKSDFSQKEKDNMIERVLLIGSPLHGSLGTLHKMLGGGLDFKVNKFGYDMKDVRDLFVTGTGAWDLIIKDVYSSQKDDEWAKDLQHRLQREKTQKKAYFEKWKDMPYSFYPSKNQECNIDNKTECFIRHFNLFEKPLLEFPNEKKYMLTRDNILEILENYSVRNRAEINGKKLHEKAEEFLTKDLFHKNYEIPEHRIKKMLLFIEKQNRKIFHPPGVPLMILFSSMTDTPGSYNYKINPLELTNDGLKPENKTDYTYKKTYGDGTITAEEATLLGFKWAYEYEDGDEDARPVNFIEYCSNYNRIFEDQDDIKEKLFLEKDVNNYYGMPCENKTHMLLIQDQYIVKLIAKLARSSSLTQIPTKGLDSKIIHKIKENCPHILAPQSTLDLVEYASNLNYRRRKYKIDERSHFKSKKRFAPQIRSKFLKSEMWNALSEAYNSRNYDEEDAINFLKKFESEDFELEKEPVWGEFKGSKRVIEGNKFNFEEDGDKSDKMMDMVGKFAGAAGMDMETLQNTPGMEELKDINFENASPEEMLKIKEKLEKVSKKVGKKKGKKDEEEPQNEKSNAQEEADEKLEL